MSWKDRQSSSASPETANTAADTYSSLRQKLEMAEKPTAWWVAEVMRKFRDEKLFMPDRHVVRRTHGDINPHPYGTVEWYAHEEYRRNRSLED
jgi:hypothetical protein